jgi:hypothetical protein
MGLVREAVGTVFEEVLDSGKARSWLGDQDSNLGNQIQSPVKPDCD